jgi:hypothetical protein
LRGRRVTAAQLRKIQIRPSRFGIYFPRLGVDIYLPALWQGFLGSQASMAARLGAVGENLARKIICSVEEWEAGGQVKGEPQS